MIGDYEFVLRLIVASFLGGVIGYEREKFNKPAGLRTLMLVAMGAAMIMMYSENAFGPGDSSARVASGVITGIGFLGAGSIIQSSTRVRGLTTAASIWIVAIIGMCAGEGQYFVSSAATIIVVGILYFSRIEEKVAGVGLPRIKWFPIKYVALSKKGTFKHKKFNHHAEIKTEHKM